MSQCRQISYFAAKIDWHILDNIFRPLVQGSNFQAAGLVLLVLVLCKLACDMSCLAKVKGLTTFLCNIIYFSPLTIQLHTVNHQSVFGSFVASLMEGYGRNFSPILSPLHPLPILTYLANIANIYLEKYIIQQAINFLAKAWNNTTLATIKHS